jgi:hypothetical protein
MEKVRVMTFANAHCGTGHGAAAEEFTRSQQL